MACFCGDFGLHLASGIDNNVRIWTVFVVVADAASEFDVSE